MSVPGVTKCPRVQTFLVISVTIILVTSCGTGVFPASASAVPSSQQLDAINPAFFCLTSPRKAGHLATLLSNCRYSLRIREGLYSRKLRHSLLNTHTLTVVPIIKVVPNTCTDYCQTSVKRARPLSLICSNHKKRSRFCRHFFGALGRTRTCDLLIRS